MTTRSREAKQKDRLSYTKLSTFLDCRQMAFWRYEERLVPLKRDPALRFGSLFHECLSLWHQCRDLGALLAFIDERLAGRLEDAEQRHDWHLARAMMTGYAARYPHEDFEVVAVEHRIESDLRNPKTNGKSRTFDFTLILDLLVKKPDGTYWVVEHKTAAQIDGPYLERLWMDLHSATYAVYAEKALGVPIAGVLYNVVAKARLQQGSGETEAEFEARRAELVAKSKTGTSKATRRLPESDDAFAARLAAKYADAAMFHREELLFSRDELDAVRGDLWELARQYREARRLRAWNRNTGACFKYHKPCPYFDLCRSGGNPNLIENLYRRLPVANEPKAEPTHGADAPACA